MFVCHFSHGNTSVHLVHIVFSKTATKIQFFSDICKFFILFCSVFCFFEAKYRIHDYKTYSAPFGFLYGAPELSGFSFSLIVPVGSRRIIRLYHYFSHP